MAFSGKVAIVTGGTGALGRVIAEQLFSGGASIAIPYHSESSASALPRPMTSDPGRFLGSKTDLGNEHQVRSFTDVVMKKFGRIDFLVCAAGAYAGGNLIEETAVDELDKMLSVNLRTTFLACRCALPIMRRQNSGRIITIASMPAMMSSAKKGAYAISKRGVITLTETIAVEVKGTGITANAIAPSTIVTDENKRSMPGADISKWVTPGEIAELVAYLCSDQARSVSGNTIKVYGGS